MITVLAAAHHLQQSSTAGSIPKGVLGAAIMSAFVFSALWVLSRLAKALSGGSRR